MNLDENVVGTSLRNGNFGQFQVLFVAKAGESDGFHRHDELQCGGDDVKGRAVRLRMI